MRSATLPNITHLLDAERKTRQRKKHRRNAQQLQAELRMYVRYVNEEWHLAGNMAAGREAVGCPNPLTVT